jgi:putative endonuclease
MARRQDVGKAGEQAVADQYVTEGFVVLDRNWRLGRTGELDVIVGRAGEEGSPSVVVVCEVKTRSSDRFGSGLEAVTLDKQRRLRQLAAAWMTAHRDELSAKGLWEPFELRIDVAAVMVDWRMAVTSIEVVEGAC